MTPSTRRRGARAMTFLSLFAGVGGFDLALDRLGMRCVGQVELDPVCRSVLARHFPEVPRHDDVRTTTAWWAAEPRPRPDLITAGFPCQDVSAAGHRAGLAGPRTGLFFDLARVVDALSPRWVLLENVPGLLSSNRGEDFRVVVATLAQLGYGVAWRVLDARFFGVPQRRRRVFVVGHRGTPCPFAVLFEPDSGPRNPAAGRTPGPDAAATFTAGTPAARRPRPAGRRQDDHNLVVAATLTASYGSSTPRGDGTDTLILHPPPATKPVPVPLPGSADGRPPGDPGPGAAALYTIQGGGGHGDVWATRAGPSYTLDTRHPHLLATPTPIPPHADPALDTLAPRAVQARSFAENQRREVLTAEVVPSLGTGGGKPGQGYPAVMLTTPACEPRGNADDDRAGARPAPTPWDRAAGMVVAGTLTARCGKGANSTADDGALVIQAPHPRRASGAPAQLRTPSTAGRAPAGGTPRDGQPLVTVRRLTPRECERLQGFLDDWTALDADGRAVSDTARYRAMGNAVTVPVVAWIGRRLLAVTLAHAGTGHPPAPPPPLGGRRAGPPPDTMEAPSA
jgi:site-specific DNA-cytosine methylase